jgi:hypothetical protein
MRQYLRAILTTALVFIPFGPARADDVNAKSILDKAIKALGGEEKLSKVAAYTWKAEGTINFNGNENQFDSNVTVKGLDHLRREVGSDNFNFVVVLAGDKGWRKGGDNSTELEGDALANEKRGVYLQVIPITIVPLKQNGFKYETSGEEKVGDKPAVILKITGPDGKDFTLYLDKESGLPVKQVARVLGFQGQEYTAETTFADYKDFDGIKKATKIEVKRDGEPFQKFNVKEFKVLDKVEPESFTEPK